MKLELKFAELHSPLFLSGTNLQMKLDPSKRHGMSLTYDRTEKELLVEYKGELAIIPTTNVVSMTPKGKEPEKKQETKAPDPELARSTAQVSSPQSHVHAGPGHGQTGQTRKVVL